MTDNVARFVSVPQPVPIDTVPVKTPPPEPTLGNDNEDASRYRLTIEAVGGNRYVYMVRDRVTGEVIRQLPSEDVAKLHADPTYRGGRLVNTAV